MEKQIIKITVPGGKRKERLDIFLTREIRDISRSRIQKLIHEGMVLINGDPVKAGHPVEPGTEICITLPMSPPHKLEPEAIPLTIVHEDEYLLVIDKPAGMVVHPAYGHRSGTLVHALLHHTKTLSAVNTPERPGIVHRLDKDTSGLLVVAKNDSIHHRLSLQFSEKTTERLYTAFIWGHLKSKEGKIETHLARSSRDRKKVEVSNRGRKAVTLYRVEEKYPLTSRITLRLLTGRTHQIRVHMAYLGHPVLGDPVYGGRGARLGGLNHKNMALAQELLQIMNRQALHARVLGFKHPVAEKFMRFESEPPEDMRMLMERLSTAMKGF
ncbi:MAG TPA: RluA family pseudouridine synthase [bacterium]|nr:RluA family pseudouridine synthase [bacterium]